MHPCVTDEAEHITTFKSFVDHVHYAKGQPDETMEEANSEDVDPFEESIGHYGTGIEPRRDEYQYCAENASS